MASDKAGTLPDARRHDPLASIAESKSAAKQVSTLQTREQRPVRWTVDVIEALAIPTLPSDLRRVEVALQDAVRTDDSFITEVASHLMSAGGKRIRPALALSAAYASRADTTATDDVVAGAVAVELVHLGTLYHDDVIDEAQIRRSVDSVNARWGNIVAILAGDFLLARASQIAAPLGIEVAELLAGTIGEICKGEVRELQSAFDVTRDIGSYMEAITGKTAALMATSCRIGALVAGLERPSIEALTSFGQHLGVIFQIVDDVLDVQATQEELGKPAGNDILEGVYTLPVILALEESAPLREVLGRPLAPEELDFARALVKRAGVWQRVKAVATTHTTRAISALNDVGSALDSGVLKGLARLCRGLNELL